MGHLHNVFPITAENGEIAIHLGQGFRPNPQTKKIYHFCIGYTTWVITANKSAKLSFKSIEQAIQRSLEIIGAVEVEEA